MQGMGWTCLEELVWGDKDHKWVKPGVLHTRGPGQPPLLTHLCWEMATVVLRRACLCIAHELGTGCTLSLMMLLTTVVPADIGMLTDIQ